MITDLILVWVLFVNVQTGIILIILPLNFISSTSFLVAFPISIAAWVEEKPWYLGLCCLKQLLLLRHRQNFLGSDIYCDLHADFMLASLCHTCRISFPFCDSNLSMIHLVLRTLLVFASSGLLYWSLNERILFLSGFLSLTFDVLLLYIFEILNLLYSREWWKHQAAHT